MENHKQNDSLQPLKTSCEIIKEAKASLRPSIMNARIVKTNRPFTPRSNQRIFFEEKRNDRPTSSVSFQKVKYQETEVGAENLRIIRNSRTKLPSLVNYQSMTSLEKLPEENEMVPDQREVYSSPVIGSHSEIFNSEQYCLWFPLVPSSSNMDRIRLKHDTFEKSNTKSKYKEGFYWSDEEKSIQENKINEARAILKSVEKDTVQSVLAAINKYSLKAIGYADDDMIALLKKLYCCLQDEQQIQFSNDQHLAKNLILKTIFNFIESPNEMLLLHIVQIILLLRVSGKNLSTACKLIFKISRSDKNDEYFLERNIIGSFVNCLGLATPDEDSEALIYGYGALKFLMMNSSILQCALDNGILQLMALHLKMINLAKTENSDFPEPISHVLFQLTGCLRNVANDESTYIIFVNSGTLTAISKTIKLFICDIDLVVNVARIMSILSLNEECCEVIVDSDSLHTLLRVCKKYPCREDIIVRIMYALGNTVANSERARLQLFTSPENTLEVILNLLQFYVETDLKLSLENTLNKFHLLSVEDVFVKIIRVIANMCIDENVGLSLVSTNNYNPIINEFLDCLLIILRRKTIHESEELVLSILSTLNNLSYYCLPNMTGPFGNHCLNICEALNSLMATRNEECVLEVGRVYGNLSRSAMVRKYLLETGALNYVIDWLDSDNKDLLLVTTGVLINMMVEKEARAFLRNTKGIEKLIENLRVLTHDDWHLSSLICQVIWNFSIEEDDLFAVLGNHLAQNLLNVLIDLLDEDHFFSDFNDHSKNSEYKLWEEFSTIAINILEKMEPRNNSE